MAFDRRTLMCDSDWKHLWSTLKWGWIVSLLFGLLWAMYGSLEVTHLLTTLPTCTGDYKHIDHIPVFLSWNLIHFFFAILLLAGSALYFLPLAVLGTLCHSFYAQQSAAVCLVLFRYLGLERTFQELEEPQLRQLMHYRHISSSWRKVEVGMIERATWVLVMEG